MASRTASPGSVKNRPASLADVWAGAGARGLPRRGVLLVVDVRRQVLWWVVGGRVRGRFRVSTARKGLDARAGSLGTPPGWHRVAARLGRGLRRGSVLVSRRFTGEVMPRTAWREGGSRDRILSRILRLRGLEPGLNRGPGVDSYARFIYLHGTNQEQRLGRPASHGCIRLANDDVMRLFNRLGRREAWCWIGYLDPGAARWRA